MEVNPDGDATIACLLERMSSERGDATFLIDPSSNRITTYAGLGLDAAAMGAALARLGARRGDRIALAMSNSVPAVVGILGAMSGAFVAVPLDPSMGRPQLVRIVRDCAARVVLFARAARAHAELLAADLDARVEEVEPDLLALIVRPKEREEGVARPLPADDAVLMYTSGSTGRPKGVLVSHRALLARVHNHARAHEITSSDRFLCVLPLYHMSAFVLVLAVLHTGGSCVLPERFRVADYWDWVATHGCTWLGVVPTVVAQLLQWGETHHGPAAGNVRAVRFARCSSAPLSTDAHRAFEERFGILLITGMGMTETGGIFLNPPDRARRKIGSLGRSCGLEAMIVDADGQGLANGQAGDLLVRGAAVMRGYHGDPEGTTHVLDAVGWLRTGDRAYRDDDGFFYHAGRSKDLIIKAGSNIAPLEIDEALARHPDVLQAVAVGVPDSFLGEDIGGFVVLRAGARCSERALLDHCEASLGEFKTPSWIRVLDALPTGSGGKVLRGELAARAAEGAEEHTAEAALDRAGGRSAEQVIRTVWAEVLERGAVGVDDNFFALGGTSLLAVRVTTRLRHLLGIQLSLPTLLGAPTVAEQAALVRGLWRSTRVADVSVFETGSSEANKAVAVLLSPFDAEHARTPLFCVYAMGTFLPLAQMLGPRHPVYGVAIGPAIAAIEGGESTASFAQLTVEGLARVCVTEIRRVQAHGPYQVGGFSFGGRVALEVAQQLLAAGEQVHLLLIFDTFMPRAFRRRPLRWLAHHAVGLRREGLRYLRGPRRREQPVDNATPALGTSDAMASLARREGAFRRALGQRYHPQSFAQPIVLFRATRNEVAPHYRADPLLGWGRFASNVSVHDIPTTHHEILDERFSSTVADVLRRYLHR